MTGTELIPEVRSRFVRVDGIRTHYLEAGDGPPVVLLHDGGWGGCGAVTWFPTIPQLARQYRVIAPDWLGFGETDKLHDFVSGRARRLWHMTRFLETLDLPPSPFLGCSMGATLLLQVVAGAEQPWPVSAMVAASGGGFVPMNDARRQTMEFDGSLESMRTVVSALVHDPKWLEREELVERRLESATRPGAWEAVAAARFKSPLVESPNEYGFGAADATPYERITVPTLLIAGAQDKLRLPGYADEVGERIPDCRTHVLDECGHLPQIEQAAVFNDLVLDFLGRVTTSREGTV